MLVPKKKKFARVLCRFDVTRTGMASSSTVFLNWLSKETSKILYNGKVYKYLKTFIMAETHNTFSLLKERLCIYVNFFFLNNLERLCFV